MAIDDSPLSSNAAEVTQTTSMAIDDSPLSSNAAEVTQTTNNESQAAQNQVVFYKTKRIFFGEGNTNIVLQDMNGPCPLLAICNVLILRGEINLDLGADEVSQDHLLSLVDNMMLKSKDEEYIGIELLKGLAAGIFVDPIFTSIHGFESTPELTIFSSLRIPLYHGWIVDPMVDLKTATAIGGRSYNALTTELAALETRQTVEDQCSGECSVEIQRFLNASQLTLHGLCTLKDYLQEGELCVLFRNNHFSTMLKHDGNLFTLVTDQGYLREQDLVWESLNQIDGDSVFITGNFEVFKSGNWDKEDSISKKAEDKDKESDNKDSECQVSTVTQMSVWVKSSKGLIKVDKRMAFVSPFLKKMVEAGYGLDKNSPVTVDVKPELLELAFDFCKAELGQLSKEIYYKTLLKNTPAVRFQLANAGRTLELHKLLHLLWVDMKKYFEDKSLEEIDKMVRYFDGDDGELDDLVAEIESVEKEKNKGAKGASSSKGAEGASSSKKKKKKNEKKKGEKKKEAQEKEEMIPQAKEKKEAASMSLTKSQLRNLKKKEKKMRAQDPVRMKEIDDEVGAFEQLLIRLENARKKSEKAKA